MNDSRPASPARPRAPFAPSVALLVALALAPSPAGAVETTLAAFSPGVKVGYTIGRGFTYGLEVSWIWAPTTVDDWKRHPYATGVVVALDSNFKGLFRLHVPQHSDQAASAKSQGTVLTVW